MICGLDCMPLIVVWSWIIQMLLRILPSIELYRCWIASVMAMHLAVPSRWTFPPNTWSFVCTAIQSGSLTIALMKTKREFW